MSNILAVLSAASEGVVPAPSKVSSMKILAEAVVEKTTRAAARYPEVRDVVLGGSFAKGTWLSDETDLDIFVRFDPSTPENDFERIGLAVGASTVRGHPRGKKYAQHPYTEATVEGVKVNIVPCYSVPRGEWKSAADRSPYHVDLVKGVSEETKTQIRLMKRFMKAVGVYGAELETRGFSGYVAEVIVIAHGGFLESLSWLSSLQPASESRMFSVPDPVDPSRDLGIAVSAEKFGQMVLASREFLRRPGRAFFTVMKGKPRPALRDSVIAVVFSHKKLSEDILWGELRRTSRHVVRHLEERGFRVARAMCASNNMDRSAILLIPEFDFLPKTEQRIGPTVDRADDLRSFLASNRDRTKLVWVDDEARVRLLVPRDEVDFSKFLAAIAKGRAGPTGASRELGIGLKKSARILKGKELKAESSRSRWLGAGISEIVTDAIGTR